MGEVEVMGKYRLSEGTNIVPQISCVLYDSKVEMLTKSEKLISNIQDIPEPGSIHSRKIHRWRGATEKVWRADSLQFGQEVKGILILEIDPK